VSKLERYDLYPQKHDHGMKFKRFLAVLVSHELPHVVKQTRSRECEKDTSSKFWRARTQYKQDPGYYWEINNTMCLNNKLRCSFATKLSRHNLLTAETSFSTSEDDTQRVCQKKVFLNSSLFNGTNKLPCIQPMCSVKLYTVKKIKNDSLQFSNSSLIYFLYHILVIFVCLIFLCSLQGVSICLI